MANHEQEDVSTNSGDDWLADAIGTEGATAAPVVESTPQSTGDVPSESSPVEVESSDADKVTADRERDERGRFKAKAQETQGQPEEADGSQQDNNPDEDSADEPEATQRSDDEDDGRGKIPSWRVRELRESRDAERSARVAAEQKAAALENQTQQAFAAIQHLQQQIQHLQNPQKPNEPAPNLFEDPDAFVSTLDQRFAQLEKSFQRQRQQDRLEMNLAMTHRQHPDEFPEALQSFYQAAETDRALQQRVFASADQGGTIIAWHREQRTLKEIGTDPNAYLERKLEEKLKDPAFLAKALEAAKAQAIGQPAASATPGQPATRPNTVVKRPPSLSGVPGGASAHAASSSGGDWLNEALSGR